VVSVFGASTVRKNNSEKESTQTKSELMTGSYALRRIPFEVWGDAKAGFIKPAIGQHLQQQQQFRVLSSSFTASQSLDRENDSRSRNHLVTS
jgi:hypothetical protein